MRDAWPGGLPTRRRLLIGTGAFLCGGLAGRVFGAGSVASAEILPVGVASPDGLSVTLQAAERRAALACFGGRTLPLWTFSDETFLPVLRLKAGERLSAQVLNSLSRAREHVTIHWHGIRLPNGQDGVPFLTQPPIQPGETFVYDFSPPDAGTFFFHTHCNTAEQLGRGLAGLLIVEGDETEPYDAERILALRDFSVSEDNGSLGPFLTDEAARAGTFGNVRSCNGVTNPEMAVPASADVRLRILNIDRTRVMQLGIEGAECAIIAIDGMPVAPFPLKAWFAGPATRIDVAMRSPGAGGGATLFDYFAPEPVPLAHFSGEGDPVRNAAFDPAPLKPNQLPEPDLEVAERQVFTFSATATAEPVAPLGAEGAPAIFLDDLCTTPRTFWAINKRAWASRDHSQLPPPIATLKRDASYVFELRNATPHMHPIHIHGHSFKWLKSNERDLPIHHADTVLLQPKERVEVAFVADNPGDWMFHCHIIEHQETGMMSYIRVV